MKKILLLLITVLFFLFPSRVQAANEFKTSFWSTYEVKPEGVMQVASQISLTNRFSNIYATSYSLSFDGEELEKIYASDKVGPIKFTKTKSGSKTTINLTFNDSVVGVDETLTFNFGYQTKSLIKKTGQIWEINIPRQSDANNFDSFDLILKVPNSFGVTAYVSPEANSVEVKNGAQLFNFTKEQVVSSGVVAAFGKFQVFDFNFSYFLNNPSLSISEIPVALPPDTSYQKVSYQSLTPKPSKIEVDSDGNWLAYYKLKPKESVDISLSGQVKIFADPISLIRPQNFNLNDYLKPQQYWESDNPKIKELAKKYKTPQEIYKYVVGSLKYDYSRVREGAKRMGALQILETPDRAICMEFTDLFVAIARSAGIPARELNGYAYTNDQVLQPLSLAQDILHAWPEYWDTKLGKWIQIDPTWEATTGGVDFFSKLDLGHFVLAIHGQSSLKPYPVGAYKEEGSNSKDIKIDFGVYKEPKNVFLGKFDLSKHLYSERETNGKFIVENAGNEALYNLPYLITNAADIEIVTPKEGNIAVLPPYSTYEIPIKISSSKMSLERASQIKIQVKDKEFENKFIVSSLLLSRIFPALLIIGGLTSIILNVKRILKLFRKN